jgi:UDPglucose 6-dehydrogenase
LQCSNQLLQPARTFFSRSAKSDSAVTATRFLPRLRATPTMYFAMRIVVFGAGYVGLVTGTGLSGLGHNVLIVDSNPARVEQLASGTVPIYEPGLADLVRRNHRNGRLGFETKVPKTWLNAQAYYIAVGTPSDPDGSADVSRVFDVAEQLARSVTEDALVVIKSTVPVGTCDAVQERIAAIAKVELEVVSNPEFLKEGDAVADFFKPERIVLGVRSDAAAEVLRSLYAPLQLSGERIVRTDPRSSELIKYASNAMLAMRVSFMNELAQLCHATGADIHSVRLGVGADSRIGKKFLYAGPGYGGSCFPKDVLALIALGKRHNVEMKVAEATHAANRDHGEFLVKLVAQAMSDVKGKTLALWGLAFKPETDDVREAPSVRFALAMLARGAVVRAHDPEARENFLAAMQAQATKDQLARLTLVETDYAAADGAHALVLLTEWRSYRAPNFRELRKRMVNGAGTIAPIIDARNIWKPADAQRAGLRYQGIGVPSTGSTFSAPSSVRLVGKVP